jgi:hypothetical protein
MAFVAGFFAVIMLDINPDAVVAAVIELPGARLCYATDAATPERGSYRYADQ